MLWRLKKSTTDMEFGFPKLDDARDASIVVNRTMTHADDLRGYRKTR
jgi:hypothetical protein